MSPEPLPFQIKQLSALPPNPPGNIPSLPSLSSIPFKPLCPTTLFRFLLSPSQSPINPAKSFTVAKPRNTQTNRIAQTRTRILALTNAHPLRDIKSIRPTTTATSAPKRGHLLPTRITIQPPLLPCRQWLSKTTTTNAISQRRGDMRIGHLSLHLFCLINGLRAQTAKFSESSEVRQVNLSLSGTS